MVDKGLNSLYNMENLLEALEERIKGTLSTVGGRKIRARIIHMQVGNIRKRGFTLIELLVVISIISMIMAISLPAFNRVRLQARALLSMNNMREVTSTINLFASDNNDRYPESVATVGSDDTWRWTDSTKLIGINHRSPQLHRAMSEYLRKYIPDASTMYCPNVPHKYKLIQQAWDAGDSWDNPNTYKPVDPVGGSYCFYWNYRGYLGGRRVVFRGPQGPASSRRYSKLLMSDYFGYDHWRNTGSYSSCEPFEGADITEETWLLSSFWHRRTNLGNAPEIKLKAGYTDGHVENYSASDVVPMRVSITPDGTVPYPDGESSPGIFYIPRNALH
jgi:prepilin-type N-terminal cleavage/methylation domain-containing protein